MDQAIGKSAWTSGVRVGVEGCLVVTAHDSGDGVFAVEVEDKFHKEAADVFTCLRVCYTYLGLDWLPRRIY